MADWSLPLLSSNYSDFLSLLKSRDIDTGTLFSSDPTNPVVGMIRYNRTTNTFDEWDGSAWQPKIISVAAGGTGANAASGARTNLGLGTIATQNANAVNITGGTVSNLGGLSVNGNATIGGTLGVTGVISGIGSGLTTLNASNLSSGTVPGARLGSNYTGGSARFLREDNSWQDVAVFKSINFVDVSVNSGGNAQLEVVFNTGYTLTDYTKTYFVKAFDFVYPLNFRIPNNTQIGLTVGANTPGDAWNIRFRGWLVELKNVG